MLIFVKLNFLNPRSGNVPFVSFLTRCLSACVGRYALHICTHRETYAHVCIMGISRFTLKIPCSYNAKKKSIILIFPQGDFSNTMKQL